MAKKTKCKRGVADHYAAKDETIFEFSFPNGEGGLISFQRYNDGQQIVELYRLNESLAVVVPLDQVLENS